jgi:hypothetical protein
LGADPEESRVKFKKLTPLEIVHQVEPKAPPSAPPEEDVTVAFNMRLKASTVDSLERAAKGMGLTMKQVITNALAAAKVEVAEADLEDGSPHRQRKRRRKS